MHREQYRKKGVKTILSDVDKCMFKIHYNFVSKSRLRLSGLILTVIKGVFLLTDVNYPLVKSK